LGKTLVHDVGMAFGDEYVQQYKVLEINFFFCKNPPDFGFEMLVVRHGFKLQHFDAGALARACEGAQSHVKPVERSAGHEADDEAAAFAGDGGELQDVGFHAAKVAAVNLPPMANARSLLILTLLLFFFKTSIDTAMTKNDE
jgi:hypothetical protein